MKYTYLLCSLTLLLLVSCNTSKKFNINETEIYCLGTIHSNHLIEDFEYSLSDLENVVSSIKPDLICSEMTKESLGSQMEGYFPPENIVLIEYAETNQIPYEAVDWRNDLNKDEAVVNMTQVQKEEIQKARNKVDQIALGYMMQNDWKGYYNFIQKDTSFHQAIKEQHDTKIKLLGEASDGYWLKRNKIIVENIIKAIKEKKSKKVLITFGLHHKYIIKELMSQYGLEAKILPDIEVYENKAVSDKVLLRWGKNRENLKKLLEDEAISSPMKGKIKSSKRIQELDKFINSQGKASISIRQHFEKQ